MQKILKVYFPTSLILDATLGSHPSQIWRAILEGRDILVQGLVGRVGDGATTHIWQDNWLPREGLMRLIVSLTNNPPQLVKELIDGTSATWREDLICNTFLTIVAESITSIPLCTRVITIFWSWNHEKNGIFTV